MYRLMILISCCAAFLTANLACAYIQKNKVTPRSLAVESLKNRPEVVFIGSSHFRAGIDPRAFPYPISNLNHPTIDFHTTEMVLAAHMATVKNAKALLVELDLVSLHINTADFFGTNMQLSVLGVDDDASTEWFNRIMKRYFPACRPNKSRPSQLVTMILEKSSRPIPGFVPMSGVMVMTGPQSAAFHNEQFSRQPAATFDRNVEALKRIIGRCQHAKVPLYLIECPHAPMYMETIEPHYREEYASVRQMLTDENITVINAVEEGLDVSAEDFFDGHHLNANGAVKFSEFLKQQLSERLKFSRLEPAEIQAHIAVMFPLSFPASAFKMLRLIAG